MSSVDAQYLVNSFNAIDEATGKVIAADERGFISPPQGTVVVFQNPNPDKKDSYVEVTDIVVEAAENSVKLQINDNELYPMYVDANNMKGLTSVYVYKIVVIDGGPFRYEALSSRA